MGFHPAQKQTSEKTPRNARVREKAEERPPSGLHEFPFRSPLSSGAPPGDLPIAPSHLPFLQRTIGNRTLGRVLQTQLTIGQPNDQYEQEADRVAEQVMRMPAPVANGREEDEEQMVQAKPLAAQISPLVQRQVGEEEEEPLQAKALSSAPYLQRKCPACESGNATCPKCAEKEKLQTKPLAATITPFIQRQTEMPEEEETVQTKTALPHTPQVTPNISANINAMRGNGQSLPASARAFFEPRFGVDFSGVRVHTNGRAAETSRAVNARAFTVGRDVAFGAGEFRPGTFDGRRLLDHELMHTVRQNIGSNVPGLQRQTSNPDANCFCLFKGKIGKLEIDSSCIGNLSLWVIPEDSSVAAFTPATAGTNYSADGFKIGSMIYKIDGSTCVSISCSGGNRATTTCLTPAARALGKRGPYIVPPGTFTNEPPPGSPARPVR